MAITQGVSDTSADYSGLLTNIVSPSFVSTAASACVVAWRYSLATSPSAVTDTDSNSYTIVPGTQVQTGNGDWIGMAYALNVAGSAGNVISVITASPAQYWGLVLVEYAGVALVSALDQSDKNTGNGGTVTTPTITTSQNDEVIVSAAQVAQVGNVWTPGAGFAQVIQDIATVLFLQDQIVAAPFSATVSATYTPLTFADASICVLSLKAAGGGGGTTWPGYQSPFGWS